jgi:hypothetical protein
MRLCPLGLKVVLASREHAGIDLLLTVPVFWLVDICHQREPRKTRNTRKLEKKIERRCVQYAGIDLTTASPGLVCGCQF